MRTIETTLYQFAELSDDAKETARDWFRGCIESDEISDTYDWQEIAGRLGIEFATHSVKLYGGGSRQEPDVYWSGFSSQGDGASWAGWYGYKPGAPARIAEWASQDNELQRIARELQTVQRRNFYRLQATVTAGHGHYSHEYSMRVDVSRTDDVDVSETDDETLTELLRDFARWIYRQLEAQWDYLNSDEAVDESIEANKYEFTENGERA